MKTQLHHVRWTLPSWAAELIMDTLTVSARSAETDPRLRKQITAALESISQTGLAVRQPSSTSCFDLFRLSKSKQVVDICPNTLRAYNNHGLPFYHRGKAIFVSKAELATFIMYAPYEPSQPDEEEP